MKKIKIALADDHPLILDGMTNWINKFDNMKVVWTTRDGSGLLNKLDERKSTPDILMLDLNMPGNERDELTKLVKKKYKDLKIIIFSMYNSPAIIAKLIKYGADSYLDKTSRKEEIELAINETYINGQYYNPQVIQALKSKIRGVVGEEYQKFNIKAELKELELKVIQLICQELTNVQIADQLCRSVRTIETIRMKIMEKIGAKNIAGVVKFALRENLITV